MNILQKKILKVFGVPLSFLLILSNLANAQKPNILFLFSDDHAYQAIGAYNSRLKAYAKTPNIDKLASEGMRFEKAYVTNSICGPSRAVIQTGKYSHLNGYLRNGGGAPSESKFDITQQTFPKVMKANSDYQTAVFGKWHLQSTPQAFDYYEVLPKQGRYFQPEFWQNGQWGKTKKAFPGYSADVIGDKSINWLENTRDKSKPFMMMVQFKATHRNWMPPTRYLYDYLNDSIPEPDNLFDGFTSYEYRGSASYYSKMTLGRGLRGSAFLGGGYDDKQAFSNSIFNPLTPNQLDSMKAAYKPQNDIFSTLSNNEDKMRWWYQRYMKDYLRTARALDDNIGKLLKYLKDNGLEQNTLVMYSSDQGFYLGEHGWFDKRFMYEQSLRTPLIAKWPGVIKAGSVNDTDLVSNLDFAETFLDAGGITVPADMQGKSLVPIFKGNTPADWRKFHYYQYYEGGGHGVYRHYGITSGRYKLIYFHDIGEWEFYDLKKDPDEMINQYYIPENDSIITAMKAELEKQRTDLKVTPAAGSGPTKKYAFKKWTTPLPLKGCADTNYVEYDKEVTTPDISACIVLKNPSSISLRNKHLTRFNVRHVGKNIRLSFKKSLNNQKIKIYDFMGREVYSTLVNGYTLDLPKTKLSSGIHFISIGNAKQKAVHKLFI